MKHYILIILLLSPLMLFSQEQQNEELWASPSVEGMNLGKGIVIGYTRFSPYDISSDSQVPELIEDADGNIDRIRNLTFKLRLPVLMKEKTQGVIGFEYTTSEFEFENPEQLEYKFYDQLHHKDLRSRSIKLYLNHSYNQENFLFARGSIELNGDIPDDWIKTLRYTLSAGYGWKLTPRKAWGLGFYFSYDFGSPTILPGVLYNVTWNEKWGLEALFPGMVMLRYRPTSKSIFYLGYEVAGASFNVDLGPALYEKFDHIQLRRSEVMPMLRFEREIYDFIWFSLEAGYRINLSFKVSEDNLFNAKDILVNQVDPGGFIGANIFIIPTESLKQFFKGKK